MSSSSNIDPVTLTDAPNKGYELSGKIMLSAIVILFAVIIFMVFLHLYARWYLLRSRRRQIQRRNRNRRQNLVFYVDSATTPSQGLESSVLKSLPEFVFQKGLDLEEVSECAVCLSEFEVGEKGRSLPKCKHSFHIDCIDMWFATHSTCPLCRAPVESLGKSDEVSQLVGTVSQSESEPVFVENLTTSASASTSSFGTNMKGDFSIEIPRWNELTEPSTDSASPHSFISPGGRLMSLRRILNRGLSMSPHSSTADVSSSSVCCDLEKGTSREPCRTQSFQDESDQRRVEAGC